MVERLRERDCEPEARGRQPSPGRRGGRQRRLTSPGPPDASLHFAVEDPDAPENWPRLWFIWRGNVLMASAKGHEFMLKHYLGTHTNAVAPRSWPRGRWRR